MRITAAGIGARLTSDLQAALVALTKQQSRIASGRRINAPSDDPGGTAQALGIRARKAVNAQFQRNIDEVRGTLGSAETALRSVITGLQRAKELAVQASSDSNDALARAIEASGVRERVASAEEVYLEATRSEGAGQAAGQPVERGVNP